MQNEQMCVTCGGTVRTCECGMKCSYPCGDCGFGGRLRTLEWASDTPSDPTSDAPSDPVDVQPQVAPSVTDFHAVCDALAKAKRHRYVVREAAHDTIVTTDILFPDDTLLFDSEAE